MPTPERGPASVRTSIDFRLPLVGFFDQAGAVTFIASMPLGFIGSIEKAIFIPDVAGAGAGASQNVQIRKGAAAGTAIISNLLITLANHVLGGPGVAVSTPLANDALSRLGDADVFSVTKDAGTVFSAAGGTLRLVVRQRPQGRI